MSALLLLFNRPYSQDPPPPPLEVIRVLEDLTTIRVTEITEGEAIRILE